MPKASAMMSVSTANNAGGNNNFRGGPSNQQDSVLQKFRKSFSLRFHKKGSKESSEGDGQADENDATGNLDDEDFPPAPAPEQPPHHKEDPINDQKFRFVEDEKITCKLNFMPISPVYFCANEIMIIGKFHLYFI